MLEYPELILVLSPFGSGAGRCRQARSTNEGQTKSSDVERWRWWRKEKGGCEIRWSWRDGGLERARASTVVEGFEGFSSAEALCANPCNALDLSAAANVALPLRAVLARQGSRRGAGKAKLKRFFAPLGNPAGDTAAQSRQVVESPAGEWVAFFSCAAAGPARAGEAAVGCECLCLCLYLRRTHMFFVDLRLVRHSLSCQIKCAIWRADWFHTQALVREGDLSFRSR